MAPASHSPVKNQPQSPASSVPGINSPPPSPAASPDAGGRRAHPAPPPTILLEIITPEGLFLHTAATLVELPAVDGQIGIAPGHLRLVTALETGPVIVHHPNHTDHYFIGGGFARIQPQRISVLAIGIQSTLDPRILAGCCERAREQLGDSYELATLEAACERARQHLAPPPAHHPPADPDDLARFPREALLTRLVLPTHRSHWN